MNCVGNGSAMICAFATGLLVTAVNENGEVDTKADEDRAKSNRHHVQPMKNEQTGSKSEEATK